MLVCVLVAYFSCISMGKLVAIPTEGFFILQILIIPRVYADIVVFVQGIDK